MLKTWPQYLLSPLSERQSLFSHPLKLGCLVIALTNSLAKVTLSSFQAEVSGDLPPLLRLLSPSCHNGNKSELVCWGMRPPGVRTSCPNWGCPRRRGCKPIREPNWPSRGITQLNPVPMANPWDHKPNNSYFESLSFDVVCYTTKAKSSHLI